MTAAAPARPLRRRVALLAAALLSAGAIWVVTRPAEDEGAGSADASAALEQDAGIPRDPRATLRLPADQPAPDAELRVQASDAPQPVDDEQEDWRSLIPETPLGVARAGPLTGRVLGPNGEPASVFRVRLFEAGEDWERGKRVRTARGSDGQFQLEDVEAGSYVLQASDGRLIPAFMHLAVVDRLGDGSSPSQIVLELKESAAIEGVVLDPQGEPLSSALVVAFNPAHEKPKQVMVDENGAFSFQRLELTPWILVAKSRTYMSSEPVVVRVRAGRTREGVQLHLRAVGVVTGRVSLMDGTPAAGAVVHYYYYKRSDPFLIPNTPLSQGGRTSKTIADSDGRFRLESVQPGTYRLHASLEEEWPLKSGDKGKLERTVTQKGVIAAAGTSHHELVLFGRSAVSVAGRLARDGEPQKDTDLLVMSQEQQMRWTIESRTDEDGAFTLLLPALEPVRLVLADGLHFAMPSPEGMDSSRPIVWPYASTQSTHLKAVPRLEDMEITYETGAIHGALTGQGETSPAELSIFVQPLRTGTADSWTQAIAHSDDEGRFAVESVIEGPYRLFARDATGLSGPWVDVNVVAGASVEDVRLLPPIPPPGPPPGPTNEPED